MPRPEKVQQVELIKEKISSAKSVFITDYTGLKVEEMTRLRRELLKNKAEFKIAKNTLIRRALEGTIYESVSDQLTGHPGLGLGYDDPAVPARVLHDFFKKIDKPKVKVFYLDGREFSGTDLGQIANLPSREVLLAQVIGTIQGPLASLAGTLNEMLSHLVRTIEAIRQQKEKEPQTT